MYIRFRSFLYGAVLFGMVAADGRQENVTAQIDSLQTIIGRQYYRDFDSVMYYTDKVLVLAREHAHWDRYLEAIYGVSWCADYHKRMREFQAYVKMGKQFMHDHARELKTLDPDHAHRDAMMNAAGLYYFSLGDYERALEEYFTITPVADSVALDSALLRSTYRYIGQAYYNLGTLDKSIHYFDLAGKLTSGNARDLQYQKALQHMYAGEYHFALNQYDRAFKTFREALKILEQEQNKSFVRNALISDYTLISSCYSDINRLDSAAYFLRRSFSYYTPDDPQLTDYYLRLGNLLYKQQAYDSAMSCYAKSLSLAGRIYQDNHYSKASAYKGMGQVYHAKGQHANALRSFKESLGQLRDSVAANREQTPSPLRYSLVLFLQANVYYDWFDAEKNSVLLDSCIASLDEAVVLLDRMREELLNPEIKEFFVAQAKELYNLAVKASYRGYEQNQDTSYLVKAYYFMEKSRSSVLLDQVMHLRARQYATIPPDVLEEEKLLKGELSLHKNRMLSSRAGHQSDEYAVLQSNFYKAQRTYAGFIDDLEKHYPKYYNLKYKTDPTAVTDIRQWLPDKSHAVIEYFISDSMLYVAAITRDQFLLEKIPYDPALKANIQKLLRHVNDPSISERENSQSVFDDFQNTSHDLYARILSPVFSHLNDSVTDVIIIPDDQLCYVPFEVLLKEKTVMPSVNYAGLPYLLKEHRIKYEYAASLLIETAVGNRTQPESSYLGFAPSYDPVPGHASAPLPALLAAEPEVKEVSKLWNGEIFTGTGATEKVFRDHASEAGILHLAMHTSISNRDPQNSGLIFSPDTLQAYDGFLHAHELYNMELPAQLAILSGCETGVGEMASGEGIISLARAFKYAGCSSILMSLWKVNDETTRALMVIFNENLKNGMTKDEALRQAKLSYLNHPGNKMHPHYWSTFVLTGSDEALALPGSFLLYLMAGIMILVLTGLAYWFVTRRLRSNSSTS